MLTMEWNDEVYRKVLLKEGREEGREEGIEIGETRAKQEDACRMKTEGVSVDIISRVTGLSAEEIAAL